MFADADESILKTAVAAVENAYENQAGGFSRFPGLEMFATFPGNKTYIHRWQDDLYCATDLGRVYRVGKDASVVDVTGAPITGGKRVIFTDTEDRVVMAAGGAIVSLSNEKTQILSPDAPLSTHVVFLDGYLIAIEENTQLFQYCDPLQFSTWNPLSVFSANAKPDALIAAVVTPFRELMLAGTDHIEQYEPLPNGTQPFSLRWATGEGVVYPYTLVADKTGTYGVNRKNEFVRFFGQISQDQGSDINLVLENIDDWSEAWANEVSVVGQRMIMLQMPNATNAYGTKGVTLLLDYRAKKWSFLYGWDPTVPGRTRYPAWSFDRAWNRVFAGVPGGVAVFDANTNTLLGNTYPFIARSGHVDKWGPSRIDEVRLRLKRGTGNYGGIEPRIGLRVNRDNLGFDAWEYEPLGDPGERSMTIRFGGQGVADTWQFELGISDDVPIEIVAMQIYVERMRW